MNGYFFGYESQGTLMVLQRHELHQNLYPKDIMNGLIQYYYTYFYKIMAFPSKLFGIDNTYFYLYFASIFFFHAIIFYFARLLFKKNSVAYLSSILLMIDAPTIGSSTSFELFYPRILVLPFALLAIHFFVKDRYKLAFAIIGLAMNVHITTAFPVFLMFMLYFAVKFKKIGVKSIFKCAAMFIILSAPLIYWSLSYPNVSATAPKDWLDIVTIKLSHHVAPFSWGYSSWIRGLSFVFVFLLSLQFKPEKEKNEKLIIFIFALIIMVSAATFFYYVIPLSELMTLQFWRSTNIFGIIAMIYSGNYLLNIYKKGFQYKLAAVGLGASLFMANFKGVLIFVVLILALNFKKQKRIILSHGLIFCSFVLFLGSAISSIFPKIPYIYSLKLGFLPLIIILLSFMFMLIFECLKKYMKGSLSSLKIILAVILIGTLILIFSIGALLVRMQIPIQINGLLAEHIMAPIKYLGNDNNVKEPISLSSIKKFVQSPYIFMRHNVDIPGNLEMTDWRKVQYWAGSSTKKDAVFLTPPDLDSFRMFSERSAVMEWNDVGMANFNYEVGYKLWKRAQDVCNSRLIGHCIENTCITLCRENYHNLNENQFAELAKIYEADYVVVEKPKILKGANFKLVYENNGFRVYKAINLVNAIGGMS